MVSACVRELDRRGAVHFNLSAANGETGLPDRHALYRGHPLYLEFKRPGGGTVTPKQRWWLDRLHAAGGVVLVVRDVADLRSELDDIDRGAPCSSSC